MKKIQLFTDSSVNPQKKIGFAAFLLKNSLNTPLEVLQNSIKYKRFENTSSTRLELQSFLWALDEILKEEKDISNIFIEVYTDCQNIISLKNRKEKLQNNNYHTTSGKMLSNYDLYIEFFDKTSKLNIEFIKVEGHKRKDIKNEIDNIFNLVDKASRSFLRNIVLS